MAEELVRVERDGPVAIVTLDRPDKLNALSAAVETALSEKLCSTAVTTSRAVLLCGAGRAFSAGADLGDLEGAKPEFILDYYRTVGAVYEQVAALPQLSISAIHGYCLGGAFELALATDLRIAEASTKMGFPEVEVGVVPSAGGMLRVTRMAGTAGAREVFFMSSRVTAQRAFELGLLSRVVPDGEAFSQALEVAQRLATLPAIGSEIVKRGIDVAAESSARGVLLMEQLAYGFVSGLSSE